MDILFCEACVMDHQRKNVIIVPVVLKTVISGNFCT